MSIPNILHQKAETEREKGNFLEALKLYEEVILNYQSEKNYRGIADALQGKFLTYKHLFLNSHDLIFAQLGKTHAVLSLKIAQEKKLPTAFCYFSLGEASMLFDDYVKAIEYYQKSLQEYKDGPHIGDIRYHLGEALYRSGKKAEAKKFMHEGLKEVQEKAGKLGSFIQNVWESGCHMRLAQLIYAESPDEAKEHLEIAKKIIASDSRLILRKKQMAGLLQELQEH